jgi:hypothetical protein
MADVGNAGIAPPLPPTNSRYTASGRGPYAGLQVTVNQTADLINQAVSITWTGGTPTPTLFTGHYLQAMQCWSAPTAPGPTPEQCQFGAVPYKPTGLYQLVAGGGTESYVYSRQIAGADKSDITPDDYLAPCPGGGWWVPFHAVDGTSVGASGNGFAPACGPFWQNTYFDHTTSNELDFAYTRDNGRGSELFTVDTSLEAPGLGCGAQSEPGPHGSAITPKCWLVIVPQSATAVSSPLVPSLWQNRIVIPLSFLPVGSSCALGAKEVPIEGGELASPAVASWQPALCSSPGSSPYSYSVVSEDQARADLVSAGPGGGAGMAVVSRPVDPATVSRAKPVTYAPLTLSAVVVAFNVQRRPYPAVNPITTAETRLANTRLEHLNLTPRLVAKLLTQSYKGQLFDIFNNQTNSPASGYQWVVHNPMTLFADPDFEQYNPEYLPASPTAGPELLNGQDSISTSGLVVEEPNADAVHALWQWVLSDPQARTWLGGVPDPWGMQVNPYYSTNPATNPSGIAFGSSAPENFPKSDPYCWKDTGDAIGNPPQPPRPLCAQDWFPYASSMQNAAQETVAANYGARTTFNAQAINQDTEWVANGPQSYGFEAILSITDSASAAQYGLPTASLSPAGDDGQSPDFVAPSPATILAGEQAMTPSAVAAVRQPDVSPPKGAYALPMLTYAAVTATALSQPARSNYAHFITYAVGRGQTPGLVFGDLPAGYVPLPQALVGQADAAAAAILKGAPSSSTTPGGPSTTSPAGSTTAPTSNSTFPSGGSTGSSASSGSSGSSGSAQQPASAGGAGPATAGARGRAAQAGRGSPSLATTSTPTPGLFVGALRYSLVIILALGLAAGLAARWMTLRRSRSASKGAAR